jgi:hypothetical protein
VCLLRIGFVVHVMGPRAKFDVFAAVKIRVLLIVASCSAAVGCQRFRGPCCLHLLGDATDIGINGRRGSMYH